MAEPTQPAPGGLLGGPVAPEAPEPSPEEPGDAEILLGEFDNPEASAEERLAALRAALGL